MKGSTGRVVNILQEVIETSLVANRQSQNNTHGLGRGKMPNHWRLPIAGDFARMTRQKALRFGAANDIHSCHEHKRCQQMATSSSDHSFSLV
jgi:hypothetical protein